MGFDESTEASFREAEEHNRFKRMHLRNPTQENQVELNFSVSIVHGQIFVNCSCYETTCLLRFQERIKTNTRNNVANW